MRAIQINRFGGPEVLTLTELPDPQPGRGLLQVDVAAAGVNDADTHQAENSYWARRSCGSCRARRSSVVAPSASWSSTLTRR